MIDSLFDTVIEFVRAGDGSGEGWVICGESFRKLAKRFQQYDDWFDKRIDGDTHIVFANGKECVVFAEDEELLPEPDMIEIVVYVHKWEWLE